MPSPGGDISAFLADKNFAQQCFIMSEPLTAKHQGADVQVFPVDTGYNPYTTVPVTSGDSLRKNPDRRRPWWQRFAKVGARTWTTRTHQPAHESAESVDGAGVFAEVAEAQKPFIETDETRRNGLGSMTKERWETLIAQLQISANPESAGRRRPLSRAVVSRCPRARRE